MDMNTPPEEVPAQEKAEPSKEQQKQLAAMDKLSHDIEERRLKEAKSKKRWWIKTGLLLLLIGVSIFLLFSITDSLTEDGIKSFPALIRDVDLKWLFCLIAVIIGYILFESAKYFYLLYLSTKKHFFRASLKVMFLGKYYDGITPLGTGGQPFQIYYLHKKNAIPAGVATAVPLVKFTISTFVFCALAVVLFSFAPSFLRESGNIALTTTILVVAWVSMVLNLLMPVLIIAFSLFPNFGKKSIAWIVSLLARLKIVKHKYAVMHKYIYEMREYRNSLRAILKRWWHFIPLAAIGMCSTILSLSTPFFVVIAFAGVTPTFELFLQILCLSMIAFYSASLVPTPGNSGAYETTSSLIFATALSSTAGGALGWVILIWRLLTYYIYILAGIGINIFEIIRSAYRRRKAERQANA